MNAETTVLPNDQLVCSACARLQPISEFRRRSSATGARMRQCRRCHANYERIRRLRVRQRVRGAQLHKAASEIARTSRIDQTCDFVQSLVRSFGGQGELVRFWCQEIERLKVERRLSSRVFRFCEMLFHAECQFEAMKHERRQQYDTPEWQEAIQESLVKLVQRNPELVLQASESLGCRVTWPSPKKSP